MQENIVSTTKAITLWEPYASCIVFGIKKIETRTWPTKYRGPLFIHASQHKMTKTQLAKAKAFFEKLGHHFEPNYGCLVAECNLVDCVLMSEELIQNQPELEIMFGHWQVGYYAWILENIRACARTPVLGKQGLWNLEKKSDVVKKDQATTLNYHQLLIPFF